MTSSATRLDLSDPSDLDALPAIAGVEWIEVIGAGSWSIVVRARCRGEVMAVKIAKESVASDRVAQTLAQYRTEAALLARLDDRGVTQPIEVGVVDGRPYCIMEVAPGEPLSAHLARGRLGADAVLTVAKAVAGVLAKLHGQGLIHRDIKPANICFDGRSAKLLDFGFAAESGQDAGSATVGTLDYMSPEQMGLLSRPIEGPSDLFGLGAVLFECLSGKRPRDVLAPQSGPRPWGGEVPAMTTLVPGLPRHLGPIIDKLLSQDPDARYQSAEGLLFDLERVGAVQLQLGAADHQQVAGGTAAFVGRNQERQRLKTLWQRVSEGGRGVVLLAGEPGVGKTRLLREVLGSNERGGILLYGKCSATVPFAPLRQIFDGLHRAIQHASDEFTTRHLNDQLAKSLMGREAVMEPLAKKLVAASDAPRRPMSEIGQEAYCAEVAAFVASLSSPRVPIVLLVDDIQWLDEPSSRVLEDLVKSQDASGLLIAMTCRSDEASREMLESSKAKLGAYIDELVELDALGKAESAELIRTQLGGLETTDELVDLVYGRTGGSPLAVAEYCRTLFIRGVLAPSWGRWTLDEDMLHHLALPSTVEGLIGARIARLPKATTDLLVRAAVLGHRFDATRCARIANASTVDTTRILKDAMRENLVERVEGDVWEFTHDRVSEALLESVTADDLAGLDHACGLMFASESNSDSEALYAAAHHFARGRGDTDRELAYDIFIRAAAQAANDNVRERSYDYYQAARELDPTAFERSPLHLEAFGQVCTEIHRKDEGIALLRAGARAATIPLDRARIQGKLARALVTNLETAAGRLELRTAFSELGWRSPERFWHFLQGFLGFAIGLLMLVTGLWRGKAKGSYRERLEVLCDLHEQSGYVKYFAVDPYTYAAVMRAYPFVLMLGPSKIYVNWYCNLVFTSGILGLMWLSNRLTAHLLTVAERLGDPRILTHVQTYHAMGLAYSKRHLDAEAACEKLLRESRAQLFTEDLTNLSGVTMASLTMRGHATRSLRHASDGIKHLLAVNGGLEHHRMAWFYSYAMANNATAGDIVEARGYADKMDRYFEQHKDEPYHRGIHLNNLLIMRLESGELGEAADQAIAERNALDLVIFEPRHPLNQFYILQATVRLEQYRKHLSKGARNRLTKALLLLKWRSRCELFRSYYWMLAGGQAQIDGDLDKAWRCLSRAERLASSCNNLTVLFECKKLRARLLKAQGNAFGAVREARDAASMAMDEGWFRRVDLLAKEFGIEPPGRRSSRGNSSATPSGHSSGSESSARGVRQWRQEEQLRTLISVSTAAGSSIDAKQQAGNALAETIRLLGADRGAVFLDDGQTGIAFFCGRSSDGQVLDDIQKFSRTVVERVWRENVAMVVSGSENGEASASESIVAHDLRSIIAVPIVVGPKRLGVLYLDSRFAKGVFGDQDIDILQSIGTMVGVAAEMARASRLEVEKAQIEKDLEVAGAVQKLLLPSAPDAESSLYSLASFYWAAAQSGGDWWWASTRPDGSMRVLAGDVTGHGVGAAMVTAVVAGIFSSLGGDAEPEHLLHTINGALRVLTQGQYFMTFSVVEFAADGQTVTIWNAGGPGFMLIAPGATKAKRTIVGSSPLGFDPLEIGKKTVAMEPGMVFTLFSDGCYEFELNGRAFSVSQLGEVVAARVLDDGAVGLRDRMRQWLRGSLGESPADDVTFVAVSRRNASRT